MKTPHDSSPHRPLPDDFTLPAATVEALLCATGRCLAILEPDGAMRHTTCSCRERCSVEPEAWLGPDAATRTHPEDRDALARALSLARGSDRGAARFSVRVRRRVDGWCHIEGLACNLLNDPVVGGFVCVAMDVSERRARRRAVDAGRRTLTAVADATQEIIFALDLSGHFTTANPAAARAFGSTPAAMVGRGLGALAPTDLGMALSGLSAEVRLSGRTVQREATFRRGDALVRWRVIAGPLFDDHAHMVGTFGAATDVTTLRDLEGALDRARRLESLGLLAAGVAHDLNNLFGVIGCYCEELRQVTDSNPVVRADLEEMQDAVRRATLLTRQLLSSSRPASRRPMSVSLPEVVHGLHRLLSRTLGDDIAFEVVSASGVPAVRIDPGHVEQILLNLVINARDAMPRGGTIRVRTQSDGDGRAQLIVEDDGQGMDAETASHIFEPYFTTKSQERGTGLGLATVHELVVESAGTISVESASGLGTRMTITWPGAPDEAGDEHESDGAPPSPAPGTTVLLVEDHPELRRALARHLRAMGYSTLEAADGVDALAYFDTEMDTVAVVLTDVVMPRCNGAELVERIRSVRPRMPVVFMSGLPYERPEEEALGPTRILLKPFSSDTLARALYEVRAGTPSGAEVETEPA
ncbi:ATP-binding protein [Myxococcota bacterium]|nr:ATP-binding protein [Myxococcota bacterium]